MNDSSYSVMFNISEGFMRGLDLEFDQFLRYSYASNGELKAAYYAATGRNYLSASESASLIALNESISRMTRRLRSTLDVDRSRHRRRERRYRFLLVTSVESRYRCPAAIETCAVSSYAPSSAFTTTVPCLPDAGR